MAFFTDNNETQKVDNSLWVEQYRPTTLENYVGNDHLKDKVKGYDSVFYFRHENKRLENKKRLVDYHL